MSYTLVSLVHVDEPAVEALALGRTIPGRSGWQAVVRTAAGGRLNVSSLDDSRRWIVDGRWAPGRSWPEFWNGWFSRCTLLEPTAADLAEFLTDEVAFAIIGAEQTAAES